MAELLIELFSEEIPARMQAKAEADLLAALTGKLKEAGLGWKAAFAISGPRRLTAVVEGLDARSADVREEKKGPKVGAPEQAIAGFLRGAGLKDISEAQIVSDTRKGDFYVVCISAPGRDAKDIIAEAVPEIVRGFQWPKSMRTAQGDLRWVRPLQGIVCVLDGALVPFEVSGVVSSNVTEGHRVHGRGPYTIRSWKDYRQQLEGEGHVILSRNDRRRLILEGIGEVCARSGLRWIEDSRLLEEVVGLTEWPVVILGQMDPAFLDLPPEVITLSMRTHQKYFAAIDKGTGELAPVFIVVANISARDGGVKIAEGNARVLSARLSDARFFWEKDKATPLHEMAAKLRTIAFKEELGSLGEKVERTAALARELAPKVGADPDLAERAARLAKADLVSEMVGEFPELQGVMGRYYALEEGEDTRVADAIRDHYKPQGPNDSVPADPVSIAVALADKLDTLTGFWVIDEKPTGSKDPFALRRAALGVVRLILDNKLRFSLNRYNDAQIVKHQIGPAVADWSSPGNAALCRAIMHHGVLSNETRSALTGLGSLPDWATKITEYDPWVGDSLLDFLHDRLTVHLRDLGVRHDQIDACLGMPERGDLTLIVKRVEALAAFLATQDGATLLAGYRRAANILKAEEKKGALPDGLAVDAALVRKGPAEEKALLAALTEAEAALEAPIQKEDFAGAMSVLAGLRVPVDTFFEAVMVNDADPAVRANRLALLVGVRGALHKVADFSKIEG
jgi:glycyl-tRNA synthetase beta chain